MDERQAQAALQRAKLAGDSAYIVAALRDPATRGLAAKYAAEMGASEAIPDLRRMLTAQDPHARASAAHALGKFRVVAALDDLARLAEEDAIPWVRAWAAGALGEVGGKRAVEFLVKLLADENWTVRRAAAYGLGEAGDRAALPALEAAWKRERINRRRV